MDAPILPLIAMAIGLFYAVGGLLLLRRLPTEAVMDRMLAALGDETATSEQHRTRFWMLGGAVIFASGLSLVALSRWTPAFFVGAALLQAGYLAWAARALPAEDEETRRGRRSVVQALLLYLAATAFVLWLDREGGIWRAWIEPAVLELLALLGIAAAAAALLLRQALWQPVVQPFAGSFAKRPGPLAVRLVPEYRMAPLRDDAENTPIDPAALDLDGALVARIADWDARFQALFDDDNPSGFAFPDLATEQAWFEEGLAIAGEICAAWPGILRNGLSGLDTMLDDARRSLGPDEPAPVEAAAAMAPRCGVAEIRDAIARLESLAWEKAELPEDDRAAQEEVARWQVFFTHLLAHVRERYLPELRRGLGSPVAEARRRVQHALEMWGAGPPQGGGTAPT